MTNNDYNQAMIDSFSLSKRFLPQRLLRNLAFGLSAITACQIVTPPVSAADADVSEPSLEGLYYDWSLYEMQEGGNRFCYLSSGLERSSEADPRRRPAYVLITNRPAEGKKGIVSVDPGYLYDDGSDVLMSVGRKQFHLFTHGGAAWAQDGDDLQIIAAIRSGATLVVTGRMKNGPTTTDTFSLKGFGPALVALDRTCPVAGAAQPAPARKRKTRR
jgi:invasion protein IalB